MSHDPSTPRPPLAGLDSESWSCRLCGAPMIGRRAAGDLCPPCSATPLTDRLDKMTWSTATWLVYRLANAADHGEDISLATAMDQAERAAAARPAGLAGPEGPGVQMAGGGWLSGPST